MKYEIEIGIDNNGDAFVRALSDDDSILNNSAAMKAVGAAAKEEFGASAETVGRGSSYFDRDGREAGWEWTVKIN